MANIDIETGFRDSKTQKADTESAFLNKQSHLKNLLYTYAILRMRAFIRLLCLAALFA